MTAIICVCAGQLLHTQHTGVHFIMSQHKTGQLLAPALAVCSASFARGAQKGREVLAGAVLLFL